MSRLETYLGASVGEAVTRSPTPPIKAIDAPGQRKLAHEPSR
jgi:hypothetical protein